jgi:hypothetical protein
MVECKELSGKVVRAVTLYEDGSDGPEICIEFTDGVVFNACLKTSTTLEARCTLDEGGQPQILMDYTTPAIPR